MKLRRPLTCDVMMRSRLIHRCLRPVVRAVVTHDLRNAQPVIGKHAGLSHGLGLAMLEMAPPPSDRLVVAPELQRQQFALLVKTLEPLNRNEAVDLLDLAA